MNGVGVQVGVAVSDIAIIILNGASSSGKSSIARALQRQLPEPWLVTGVDHLIDMLPDALTADPDGLTFADDGQITVGAEYQRLDMAWKQGVIAMARHGAPVIVDEVLLSGGVGQGRWRAALNEMPAFWAGVRCDLPELIAREQRRGDRIAGMAATQADIVHVGMAYDLVVDTTVASPDACAGQIIAHLSRTDR